MTRSAIAVLSVLLAAAPAAADIINVPAEQPTIQAGIDAAVSGDEVVVAPGTYFEAINFDGKAITVRSTDPNDAAVVVSTIIDGTGHHHVVQCVTGEGPDTVLSGFVVTGGDAAGGSYPDNAGGGMFNYNSSPTVTNCSFTGNSARYGGGMLNEGGNPTVTNCSFTGNSAGVSAGFGGGGMYSWNGSPTVTNCSFTGNSGFWGGGMYNYNYGSTTVTDCTFSGNSAQGLGGGMYNVDINPTVTGCSFSGNSASLYGGGMYNENSSPALTDCSFSGNSAAFTGGGMTNFGVGGNPTLTDSVVCGNMPDQIDGPFTDGGGNLISQQYCPPSLPDPTRGACCINGACTEFLTESDCLAVGGTYLGNGTDCADSICNNDWCGSAETILLGDTAFSTVGATTDGPELPRSCDEGFGVAYGQDIWYSYLALDDGTLTVSTCNQADYDTRLAAYTGDCGALTLVACNDDGAECADFTSIMNVPVIEGQRYLVRVGGFGTAAGTGTLALSLVEACAGDTNGDGVVDVTDLLNVLASWGVCPG